jgi:glycyl-radical enzyme activating protein
MDLSEKEASYLNEEGIIFDIQKFSIHDGPGIRTLVFFKGCPLNCKWCSNPEGQNFHPQIFYFSEKCSLCKKCELFCPKKKKKVSIKTSISDNGCMAVCGDFNCVDNCPAGAMVRTGKKVKVKDMIEILLKDQDFYAFSSGGITITGGEPFQQPKFLLSLVKAIKYFNINVAIETCGYFNFNVNKETIEQVDLFLFDLKLMDSEKHKKYTNKGNKRIIDNLNELLIKGKKVIIRIPIIPNINSGINDLERFIEFLKPIDDQLEEINLMPYHLYGVKKYKRLGQSYVLPQITFTDKEIDEIKKIFNSHNIDINMV